MDQGFDRKNSALKGITLSLSIYVCHHKASRFLTGDEFVPIHVGKVNSFNDIGCPGDDTGDNISLRNPFYCELTAHYWMWKNDRNSDLLGLMHYRRHLNFSDNQGFSEDCWGCVNESHMGDDYQTKYGLSKEQVLAFMGDADVALPKRWDVRAAGSGNNYDHYRAGENLKIDDYEQALAILREKYPEFSSAADRYNGSPYGYYTNMFVMKRAVFEAYSEWLFSILFELEKRIDLHGYDQQQRRVFGHIAERLLGIYFTRMIEEGALNITEAQRLFSAEGAYNGHLAPAFKTDNVPLAICFDDNYAHAGGALLRSIIDHANGDKNYDVLILEDSVSACNKGRLKALVEGLPNFELRFFDVNTFSAVEKVHTRGHFSPATYARLLIPNIFEHQEKVLFIDSDTVVNTDVAELLEMDIGNNLVAAVKDIVMEGFIRFETPSDEHTGAMPAGRYLSDYLGLTNPDGYFQAGLIVFNLELMRRENTFDTLMEIMERTAYWFLDQDIMNVAFQGRVHYLPMKWNVFHGNGNTDDFFPGLKFSTYIQYWEARQTPSMVHFAGENKPWGNSVVDFSDMYWAALRGTPWYHEKLAPLNKNRESNAIFFESREARFRNFMKKRLYRVLPAGSTRRNMAAQLYFTTLSYWRRLRESVR
ncbi:DUF4422 domain-containing protein [Salinisphaera sp. USBA-960]|nr:DUF4422 domain-containing protein [Salifodinibacter halophilus]NNC26989.1 DUF4422 domain-containing protein [Salifodinibacter halophilus]